MKQGMARRLRERLGDPALIVAGAALFVALSGIAYASVSNNSVKSKHIVNGQVKSPDIKDGKVKDKDLQALYQFGNGEDYVGAGSVPDTETAILLISADGVMIEDSCNDVGFNGTITNNSGTTAEVWQDVDSGHEQLNDGDDIGFGGDGGVEQFLIAANTVASVEVAHHYDNVADVCQYAVSVQENLPLPPSKRKGGAAPLADGTNGR